MADAPYKLPVELSVAQGEITDLRARVAELEAEAGEAKRQIRNLEAAGLDWMKRAEAAEADLARLRQGAQDARIALVELANMPLGISLEDWGRLSSRILAALVSPGDGWAVEHDDLISRLSDFRETWCAAAPGSNEEITLFLLGFDRAVSVVKDAAAPPASERGA